MYASAASLSPLPQDWAGNEPASGAGATHFQGNTSPIWQSTWLQHGKAPGAPHATPAQRLRPQTSPHEPLLQPGINPSCSCSSRRKHQHREHGETHPMLQTPLCTDAHGMSPLACGVRTGSHLQGSREGTHSSTAIRHRDTCTDIKLLIPKEAFWYQLCPWSYEGISLPLASYPAQG